MDRAARPPPRDSSDPRVDPLAQIVHQRFEDQGHVKPALDVVVGLDAAVGEDEDIFGLEALGQGDGDAAVGGVGAGGASPAVCQRTPRKNRASSPIKQAGPAALVDRFLAGLLDVGVKPMGQGRRDRSRARRPPRRSTTGETARARRRPGRWRG